MKKLDNKGLSLVELVIAIAISTMIIGAATMFMFNAQKSYRNAEYALNLQKDAQLLMEEMSNWIMESNYIRVEDFGSGQALVLYNLNRRKMDMSQDISTQLATRTIIYATLDNKLYIQVDTESTPGEYKAQARNSTWDVTTAIPASPDSINCISEYVTGFSVTQPDGSAAVSALNVLQGIKVNISMAQGLGTPEVQRYTVTDTFSLRNGSIDSL